MKGMAVDPILDKSSFWLAHLPEGIILIAVGLSALGLWLIP